MTLFRRRRPAAAALPGDPSLRLTPDAATLAAVAAQVPPPLRLPDLLAPAGWAPHPGFIDHGNGQYSTTLVARVHPPTAHTGFFHPILRVPVPRRIAVHVTPLPNAAVVTELTRHIEQHMATLRQAAKEGRPPDPYVQDAYESAYEIRDALARNLTRMLAITILVTIYGDSPEQLAAHVRIFKDATQGALWVFREAYLEQGPAWQSTLPLPTNRIPITLRCDSQTLAQMAPFTITERIDPAGLQIGRNAQTGKPAMLALHDRRLFPAGHLILTGQTRSGKSQTAKLLLLDSLLDPHVEAFVIDPSPYVDYGALAERLGRYVQIKVGTKDRWNLCAIEYPQNIAELDPEDRRLLTRKVDFLLGFLSLAAGGAQGLTPEERALAETAIRAVYQGAGITDDPTSLLDPTSLHVATPRLKPMPRLRDIVAAFERSPASELTRLALRLRPFCDGNTMDLFDGDAPPNAIQERLVVFNIEGLLRSQRQLQPLAYLVLGEIIQQRMLSTGAHRRTIIVIDEAHVLFSNPDTSLWVSRLFRMSAKLNSAVWLLTQSITDLLGDEHIVIPGAADAKLCLNNTYVNWLGRTDKEADLRLLVQQFGLSASEVDWLKTAQPGDGIWVTSAFHLMTRMLTPPRLASLVSSTLAEKAPASRYVDPLDGRQPLPAESPFIPPAAPAVS